MKFVSLTFMRVSLLFILAVSGTFTLKGQMLSALQFDHTTHDYGDIREEEGNVHAIFKFKNISKQKVFISKIETTCGCTQPSFTKDTLNPGDSGTIRATYEPRGHGGNFHKNLFVYINDGIYYQSLTITGKVIPEADLAKKPKDYTVTYSNLAFNTTIAEFPGLLNTQTKSFKIKAYNYMGYEIKIWQVDAPEYVSVQIGDSTLRPGDSLIIQVKVDGSKIANFGELRNRIGLVTDDPKGSMKFLYVYTNLKEDFSKLTAKQKKEAPVIALTPGNIIHLGTHTAGERFTYTITITNNGLTDLQIRDVVPNCECVTYRMVKRTIAPGETAQLVLTIDTVNQMSAEHSKYITIICNDPAKQEVKVKLIMTIKR